MICLNFLCKRPKTECTQTNLQVSYQISPARRHRFEKCLQKCQNTVYIDKFPDITFPIMVRKSKKRELFWILNLLINNHIFPHRAGNSYVWSLFVALLLRHSLKKFLVVTVDSQSGRNFCKLSSDRNMIIKLFSVVEMRNN